MKSTRKLIMATLMLVVAFIAATASTYAWFTSNQEAKVDDINMKAGSEGNDLQISLFGTEGTWGYEVKLEELFGSLKPSSFDKTAKGFYSLTIPENDTLFAYEKLEVNLADIKKENDANGEATFLAFDLFFRTTSTDFKKLNFDTTSAFTGDAEILKTLRIMFLVTSESEDNFIDFENEKTVIYEPNYAANSTYGNGAYYNPTNKYIAYNAFGRPTPFAGMEGFGDREDAGFLKSYTSGNYEMDETFKEGAEYFTTKVAADATNKNISIADLSVNSTVQIKVVIWLEGWDGDTTNAAALKTFSAALKFSGTN